MFDDEVAYPIVFGKVIVSLREQHRPPLKQSDLAKRIVMDQAKLSRIEGGQQADIVTARRIANGLGLTLDELSTRVEATLAQTRAYAMKTMRPTRTMSRRPVAEENPLANAIGVIGAFALVALAIDALAPPRAPARRPRRRG